MTTSLGIVGVGKIAEVHIAAVGAIDQLTIAGGYDPQGAPEYWDTRASGAPFYDTLEGLVALNPDAFLVATPSLSHADVVRDIWRLAPTARILIEKPLATTYSEARDLLAQPHAAQLVPLYHAAYAPEVEWASANIAGWLERHGSVATVWSFFSDPYDTYDRRGQVGASYENSWLDSGSNALSVLRRLGLADSTDDMTWVSEQFSTAVISGTGSRKEPVTIVTQWTVASPSKSTTLRFDDGSLAVIDHQAVAGRVLTPDNAVEAIVGWTADVPRLVQHYINLFEREVVERQPIFSRQDHQELLSMLFGVLV